MKKAVFIFLMLWLPTCLWAEANKGSVHHHSHPAAKVKHKKPASKSKQAAVQRKIRQVRHKQQVRKKVKPAPIPKKNKRELLTENNLLYQMWALSRNYQYGTTVEKDPVKAFVWLALYVESLPKSYPGVYAMLDDLRGKLSTEQRNQGYHLIKEYRAQYGLDFRLDEKDMQKAFTLQNKNYRVAVKPDLLQIDQLDFPQLIEALNKAKQTTLAQQLQQQMVAAKQSIAQLAEGRVLFGQVVVAGPDLPQDVAAQMPILDKGYFVTAIKNKNNTMGFRLNGYQAININVADAPQQVVNVGRIVMQPTNKKQRASLVGRLPLSGPQLKNLNIVLQVTPGPINSIDGQVSQRDPWYWPSANVVVLANGQFYAKNLSPTNYTLVISEPGHQSVSMQVSLNPGEVKELGSIKLTKAA